MNSGFRTRKSLQTHTETNETWLFPCLQVFYYFRFSLLSCSHCSPFILSVGDFKKKLSYIGHQTPTLSSTCIWAHQINIICISKKIFPIISLTNVQSCSLFCSMFLLYLNYSDKLLLINYSGVLSESCFRTEFGFCFSWKSKKRAYCKVFWKVLWSLWVRSHSAHNILQFYQNVSGTKDGQGTLRISFLLCFQLLMTVFCHDWEKNYASESMRLIWFIHKLFFYRGVTASFL